VFENHGRNQRDAGRTSTVKLRNITDDSWPSTLTSQPRDAHRCSKCRGLGHYGGKCLVLEVLQPPATEVEPSPISSRPTAILQTLASNRPHGPLMGEDGWEDDKWDHSTKNMSDNVEAPSKSHEDQLDRARIWQGSSSPPRWLVLSPIAPQVSCHRPSVLTRLGGPPNITDRLSVVMD
jgi:hypothetical protein